MKYEHRYVALVDIIGFSAWILGDQKRSGAVKLARIYKEVRRALEPYHGKRKPAWITLTLFSDTIVVSTKASDGVPGTEAATISEFLWCVRRIALILLKHGFLARGCIVRDKIAHNDDLVVGPAIIAVHEYESRVARYPRILVIRRLRKQMERDPELSKLLRTSGDGPTHLHVLHEFEKFFASVPGLGEKRAMSNTLYQFASEARAAIDQRLADTADVPERFEKVKWFAEYFNASVFKAYEPKSPGWIQRIELRTYY